MDLDNMTLDQLKLYKASVEVYGTPAELREVISKIRQKERKEQCTSTGD